MSFKNLFLSILISLVNVSESSRILGFVPSASHSHQLVFRPIWRELAKRGHELVVVTTDPENDPELNYTQIDISFAYEIWEVTHNVPKQIEDHQNDPFRLAKLFREFSLILCEEELLHPEIQKLMKNESEHFDLVITEILYPVMYGLAHRFRCPLIVVAVFDPPNMFHYYWGNPLHPVAFPDVLLPFKQGDMTFWERLGSTVFNLFFLFNTFVMGDSEETRFLETHFGKDTPSMWTLLKNYSMAFLNSNPAFNVRPLGPSLINIGDGVHLTPLKPLPQDLRTFMDQSKDGVIYFSLGTNVKSERISEQVRTMFMNVFRELPYEVVWKFDAELHNVPKNVKVLKWVPQQDVLRHPKVKAFITQGGLQSMEEAIFSNIPLVAIPYFADQYSNVKRYIRNGLGIYINKDELTEDLVKASLLEVINNPVYKQNAKKFAEFTKDQPMTGVEKAVWWTEFVLRHKGAPNFRNPMMDLPFYQVYLLDVVACLILMPLALIYVAYRLFRKCL